jgi:deoxyhypusine monooxygenase
MFACYYCCCKLLELLAWKIAFPLLEESLAIDPAVKVQETCELSLRRLEEQKNESSAKSTSISPFLSIDPAPSAKQGLSVDQLRYVS